MESRDQRCSHSRVFVMIKRSHLTDSGMSRGKRKANSPGAYTTLRCTRQDLSQLAINPNRISPMLNMQDMRTPPKTLFLVPIVSTPANEIILPRKLSPCAIARNVIAGDWIKFNVHLKKSNNRVLYIYIYFLRDSNNTLVKK